MSSALTLPASRRRQLRGLAGPLLIIMILAMMILPLPPFLLDLLFTFNIALAIIVLLVSLYTIKPLDFAVFPTVLLRDDAAAPVAQRRLDARGAAGRPHRAGRRRQGDRGVRPVPGRRQLRRRPGGVRDPGGDQFRGDHQGRRAHRRSQRALHPGCDAGQADGDRRRSERRPDRRGGSAQPPRRRSRRKPSSTARWTARASSCAAMRRRHHHPADQHRRRPGGRRAAARSGPRHGGQESTPCSPSATAWWRRFRRW